MGMVTDTDPLREAALAARPLDSWLEGEYRKEYGEDHPLIVELDRIRDEAAAAREALEALVPWFGQADALYLRRERDAAYVTSTHNGYTDVRSTWLAEVMTLLAALRAARASDGGR